MVRGEGERLEWETGVHHLEQDDVGLGRNIFVSREIPAVLLHKGDAMRDRVELRRYRCHPKQCARLLTCNDVIRETGARLRRVVSEYRRMLNGKRARRAKCKRKLGATPDRAPHEQH